MSIYITFPRKISEDYIKSAKINEELSFQDVQKMNMVPYYADWEEEYLNWERYFSIGLTYSDTDNGRAVYKLSGSFLPVITKESVEADKEKYGVNYVAVNLHRIICDGVNRLQLYHLINKNIENGEYAEIYNGNLEQPCIMTLKGVFNHDMIYISDEKINGFIINKTENKA